jgi:hypothetical protein
MRPRRATDNSTPSRAEVEKETIYTSSAPETPSGV